MIKLTPRDLKDKLSASNDFILIDVREEYEFEDQNIGGINIPLAEVLDQLDNFEQHKSLVFCCKSGKRSQAIAQTVERKSNRKEVYYLEGGIEKYLAEVK